MARPLRVEFEGALYHVTVRGVDRRNLFRSDGDRERLLEKLGEGVDNFELDVFLYCLMSNHLHLLVGTPRANLGQFMGWWLTAYTVFFNRKYQRSGHLTQGRYGAKLVEGDAYLLKLSRYIHLNPVQTRVLASRPLDERLSALRAYRWSSFLGYGWARHEQPYVTYGPLRELVGQGRTDARQAYRAFVEKGIEDSQDEWQALQSASRIAIGSEAFIQEVETLYEEKVRGRTNKEDIALRRIGHRVGPDHVLQVVANAFGIQVDVLKQQRRNAWDRAAAARCLVQFGGLTQRQAAAQLGLRSGAAVSTQLGNLRTELKANRGLQKTMRLIEGNLMGT